MKGNEPAIGITDESGWLLVDERLPKGGLLDLGFVGITGLFKNGLRKTLCDELLEVLPSTTYRIKPKIQFTVSL